MNLLTPAIILAVSAVCFWRADAIGRSLKQLDGGKLQRDMHDLSGDARAYPFFVRIGSLMFGAISLAGVIGELAHRS